MVTSDIKSDECVVFYPTCAHWDASSDRWIVPIHGIIYEPENDSRKRALLISLIRRSIRLGKKDLESEIFGQRLRLFLVDNKRRKQVMIRIGQERKTLRASGPNGHFNDTAELTAEEELEALRLQNSQNGWLRYTTETDKEDAREFVGQVQFVPRRGVSIISDIDDTIKQSEVLDKKALMRNTFLRKFEAVAGMAKVYHDAADQGMTIHYLTASPWQLYHPLSEFLTANGFPEGEFHMRLFRLRDSTAMTLLNSPVVSDQDQSSWQLMKFGSPESGCGRCVERTMPKPV